MHRSGAPPGANGEVTRATIGALLILLLGALTVGVFYVVTPMLEERGRVQTSDATSSTTVRIGGDNYLGYWFLNSPEMRKTGARRGITIAFTDDGGAYAERLKKFDHGEYDAVVLPVAEYLTHGHPYRYPGVIAAAIAESKGADGLVGFADKFPTGRIADLNDTSLRVVYTAQSPSSFLLDLLITDFDLFNLKADGSWRVEVGSSREVLERAKQRQGDAFVMWEPDLSQALAEIPALKPIWASDRFAGYIIDVFVFRRDFLQRNEEAVFKLLEVYFSVMRGYANDRSRLLDDIRKSTGYKSDVVESMLGKIDWFSLDENASLEFGVQTAVGVPATEGVVNSIIACTDVLVRTGRLKDDPLDGNPYLITNSSIVEKLTKRLPSALGQAGYAPVDFAAIDDEGWKRLREVATMRIEPITFQSGRDVLDDAGKAQVDKIATMLVSNYPDYRVAVRGHTGAGDEEANLALSRQRADVVAQRLIAVHGIDAHRLHAEGWGSSAPPARKPGENMRSHLYRFARVEFVLFEDNRL
jgi:outer membrane protein OmpA-like peptidoglycan-associated protein